MTPEQVLEQAKLSVRFAQQRLPGRRVLARGRLALRARLPLPRARGGDQGGRDHHQHPGHRGLRGAAAVRRIHPQAAGEDPELRQGGVERALPQRPRHGGGQLARRGADRRRAPDRVHHQRPRRARRQHLARGGGDGGAHAQGFLQPGDAASIPRTSCPPRAWCRRSPASWCSRTRRWSARTPSRTPRASTRTACSRRARPTRSCAPRTWAGATNKIVLGKLSGRNAFKQRLKEIGIELDSEDALQQGVPALQGPRRQEGRHLRRGPAGAGVAGGRALERRALEARHHEPGERHGREAFCKSHS